MKLQNNGTNPLAHGGYKLPKGGVAEIPDEIAKEWLNIPGIKQFVSSADLAKVTKEADKKNQELEEKNAKLLAEIEKLKADLAKVTKEETELDLEALKAEADSLGIQYAPNISAKTLKAKIEAKQAKG